MLVPINAIEVKENGDVVINLGADAANDDWIRANRLRREGKLEELKELFNAPMVKETDIK